MSSKLADLINPVEIPAFKIKIGSADWSFPGAQVSSRLQTKGGCCNLNGISSLEETTLLSLSDHAALTLTAMEYIKGNYVPPEVVEGVMSIFYNNLVIGLTMRNHKGLANRGEFFMGEGASDVLDFSNAEIKGDFVQVDWTKRYDSELEETFSTTIPRYEGVAICVDGTYLNPQTGMPLAIDKSGKGPDFLNQAAAKILGRDFRSGRYSWRNRHKLMPIIDELGPSDLPDLLHDCEWVPRFYVSHNFETRS